MEVVATGIWIVPCANVEVTRAIRHIHLSWWFCWWQYWLQHWRWWWWCSHLKVFRPLLEYLHKNNHYLSRIKDEGGANPGKVMEGRILLGISAPHSVGVQLKIFLCSRRAQFSVDVHPTSGCWAHHDTFFPTLLHCGNGTIILFEIESVWLNLSSSPSDTTLFRALVKTGARASSLQVDVQLIGVC